MYSSSPKTYAIFRKIACLHHTNLANTHPYPYRQVKRCSEKCKYNLFAPGLITLSLLKSVKIKHPKVYFSSLLSFPPQKSQEMNEKGKEKK